MLHHVFNVCTRCNYSIIAIACSTHFAQKPGTLFLSSIYHFSNYTDINDEIPESEIIEHDIIDSTKIVNSEFDILSSNESLDDILEDEYEFDDIRYAIDSHLKSKENDSKSSNMNSISEKEMNDHPIIIYPQPYNYGHKYRVSFPIQDIIYQLQRLAANNIRVYDLHSCGIESNLKNATKDMKNRKQNENRSRLYHNRFFDFESEFYVHSSKNMKIENEQKSETEEEYYSQRKEYLSRSNSNGENPGTHSLGKKKRDKFYSDRLSVKDSLKYNTVHADMHLDGELSEKDLYLYECMGNGGYAQDSGFAIMEDKDWLIICSTATINELCMIVNKIVRLAHMKNVAHDSYYAHPWSSAFGCEGEDDWCIIDLADTLVIVCHQDLIQDSSSIVNDIKDKFWKYFYGVYQPTNYDKSKILYQKWIEKQKIIEKEPEKTHKHYNTVASKNPLKNPKLSGNLKGSRKRK